MNAEEMKYTETNRVMLFELLLLTLCYLIRPSRKGSMTIQ